MSVTDCIIIIIVFIIFVFLVFGGDNIEDDSRSNLDDNNLSDVGDKIKSDIHEVDTEDVKYLPNAIPKIIDFKSDRQLDIHEVDIGDDIYKPHDHLDLISIQDVIDKYGGNEDHNRISRQYIAGSGNSIKSDHNMKPVRLGVKSIHDIKSGNIKPRSSGFQSKGEYDCRLFFESKYGKEFPKCRPKFLRNPSTGKCLELDGYNDELKLGFEYNGIQHYEYTQFFHKSLDDYIDQRYRDKIKSLLCRKHGIVLVIIPYTIKDIDKFLDSKFEKIEEMRLLYSGVD